MEDEKITIAPAVDVETANYYIYNIDRLHKEYLSILDSDIKVSKSMLLDHTTFATLLNYINQNLFSKNPINIALSNRDLKYTLDYSNIDILDILFSCFLNLCGLYKQKVLLLEFSNFIDLPYSNLSNLINGVKKLTPAQVDIIQRWAKTAEAQQVQDNSTKSLFLLKSLYGYREDGEQAQVESKVISTLPTADGYLQLEQK